MIRNIFLVLIFIFVLVSPVLAETQEGAAEYNIYGYTFKKNDDIKFLQNATKNIKLWEKAISESDKKIYLQEALRNYFLLSQIKKDSIEAQIGMGRIYDEMDLDELAKEHFSVAYSLNNQNPELNLRFGDFYYRRQNFRQALSYYKIAYINGYFASLYLNTQLAKLYEKLADLETSKKFYTMASRFTPNDPYLQKKIKSLDSLDYSSSQYYLFAK